MTSRCDNKSTYPSHLRRDESQVDKSDERNRAGFRADSFHLGHRAVFWGASRLAVIALLLYYLPQHKK